MCLSTSTGGWPASLTEDVECGDRRVHAELVRSGSLSLKVSEDGPTSLFMRANSGETLGSGDCLTEDGRRWRGFTWSVEPSDGRMVFGVFAQPFRTEGSGFCGPEGHRVRVLAQPSSSG
jgi:hypothetical protein